MADNNGGASFNSASDSLNILATSGVKITDSAANNATIAKSTWDALLASYGGVNTMFGYAFKASNTIAGSLISVGTGTGQINLSSGKTPATIAAGDLAADSITASALKTDAVTEIVDGVWNAATSSYTATGTMGKMLGTTIGTLAMTADGIAVSTILERLNAWVKGKYAISVTGANTDITYYKEDNSTGSFKNRIVSTGRTVQSV
jgi:hypothetical protein